MSNEFNTEDKTMPNSQPLVGNMQGQPSNQQVQPGFQQQPNMQDQQSYLEQERLLRTYKGVEFANIAVKDQIIELEKAYSEKCSNMEGKNYRELLNLRQELINQQLPDSIFGGFIQMIGNAASQREAVEVQEIIESMKDKNLDELLVINTNIGSYGYSPQGMNNIFTALQPWIRMRQEAILEEIVGSVNEDTREQLAQKKQSVYQLNYPAEVTQTFIGKIEQQEDYLENKEVEELCEGYETKSLDELKSILTILCSNTYREKFTIPYRIKIDARMDAIYVEQMEQICSQVEVSDKATVNEIKQQLDPITCKAAIKEPFYQRISRRLDDLDRMELEQLCANLESRSLEELEALYTNLRTNAYNPKYLKGFLFTTELYLNKARQNHLREVSKSLFTMDKNQVNELDLSIHQLGYEPRRLERYEAAIQARRLELDLRELTAIESDFDHLDGKQVLDLIANVSSMDVCMEAKSRYLAKLTQRQINLSYEEVTPIAVAMQQFMNSIGYSDPSILFAGISNNFPTEWEKMKSCIPGVNPTEVPVVLVTMGSLYFAITKTTCYYQSKKMFYAIPVEQIAGFGITKKLLTEAVVIQDRVGNIVPLDGSISKKVSALFAQSFSQIILFINNPGMMMSYPSTKFTIEPIDVNAFACSWGQFQTTEITLANTFVRAYQTFIANYKFGNSIRILDPQMQDTINKIMRNYEINPMDEFLIMYYDSSLFSTIKEGFAVGSKNLYIRNNGQPTIILPYLSILQMTVKQLPKNFTISIETVNGNFYEIRSVSLDVDRCNVLLQWLNSYVKDMQLFYFSSPSYEAGQIVENAIEPKMEETMEPKAEAAVSLEKVESVEQAQVNAAQVATETQSTSEPVQPEPRPMFCPNCGKPIKEGANFCSGCGNRLN